MGVNEKGTLLIDIPEGVEKPTKDTEFTITIKYKLKNPTGGFQFIHKKSERENSQEWGYAYTSNQIDAVRYWLPCLENQPCTWTLEYRINKKFKVISSGELITTENIDSTTHKYYYELKIPTKARNLGVIIGDFEEYIDPKNRNIINYYLPNEEIDSSKSTVSFMYKVLEYYEDYLKTTYPYGSYKQIFIDHLEIPKLHIFAGLAIFSRNLLYNHYTANKAYKSRWYLSLALANQFIGNYLTIKSSSDIWLLEFGLPAYLTSLFCRTLFGVKEHQYRFYKVSPISSQILFLLISFFSQFSRKRIFVKVGNWTRESQH